MNVELYINGARADLSSASFLLWNFTREDAQSPTAVKNSFTQSVTLPATMANNTIFGSAFRVDRTNGVFNAIVRNPFILRREDGTIVQRGYVKLDSVARASGGVVSYSVTLYGGLGSFIYELTYNSDGSKKSLADIDWYNGVDLFSEEPEQMQFTAQDIVRYWDDIVDDEFIGEGGNGLWSNVFNFVPCNNGIPTENFDANKAYYKPGTTQETTIPNLYTRKTEDGVTYTPRSDANYGILVTMGEKHNEWEMQDLVAYQQRPAWRVYAFLQSLEQMSIGAWTFRLDPQSSFFNEENEYLTRLWCTMSNSNNKNTDWSGVLAKTDTPASYLLGLIKVFGLMLDFDNTTGVVTLYSRNDYYEVSRKAIDISDRIARDKEFTIVPYVMENATYVWSWENVGGFCSEYKEKYGREYGSKVVHSGYEFDTAEKNVLDGIVYKGCADVLDGGNGYQIFGHDTDDVYGSYGNYDFKMAFIDTISWQLYNGTGEDQTSLTCEPTSKVNGRMVYNNGYDFVPRPQFHDASDSPVDGSNVLLLFVNTIDCPVVKQGSIVMGEVKYRVTSDNTAMLALNDGKACWDISPNAGQPVTRFPVFRRWVPDTQYMLDFSASRVIAVNDAPSSFQYNMYNAWWKNYIEDRFDAKTKKVTCYVDWTGKIVDESMFRRYYWFDNAVWVLNKVVNHSLTTPSVTQCEFVQVQNGSAYYAGQLLW